MSCSASPRLISPPSPAALRAARTWTTCSPSPCARHANRGSPSRGAEGEHPSWAFGTGQYRAHRDIADLLTFESTVPRDRSDVDIMDAHGPRRARWLRVDRGARGRGFDASRACRGDRLRGLDHAAGSSRTDRRPERAPGVLPAVRGEVAALASKQYPAITANLTSLMSGGGDERFAFGVDTLIAGMAAQVPDEGADRADG